MSVVVSLLIYVLSVYSWAIIARALLSWFPLRQGTASYKVYSFLYDVTEPYLQLFRRALKSFHIGGSAIDVSPLIGLVVLYIAVRLLAFVA